MQTLDVSSALQHDCILHNLQFLFPCSCCLGQIKASLCCRRVPKVHACTVLHTRTVTHTHEIQRHTLINSNPIYNYNPHQFSGSAHCKHVLLQCFINRRSLLKIGHEHAFMCIFSVRRKNSCSAFDPLELLCFLFIALKFPFVNPVSSLICNVH